MLFIVPAHALSVRFAGNFREAGAAFVATLTRLKAYISHAKKITTRTRRDLFCRKRMILFAAVSIFRTALEASQAFA